MDKSELEALLARIDIWLLVFGIVVVVGVAGESFFGIRHWWNSRKLQTLQNTESEAQRAEIANALGQAAAANERTSKLELEASQQRERAAKAERDLLELQERLAWRRISPIERGKFVAALKPFAGSSIEVTKLGEAEAGQFADDLLKVLTDAKWNVSLNMSGYVSPPPYGLQCVVNDATPAGKALAAILKSLPTATVESNPKLPIVASILVGLRPPP